MHIFQKHPLQTQEKNNNTLCVIKLNDNEIPSLDKGGKQTNTLKLPWKTVFTKIRPTIHSIHQHWGLRTLNTFIQVDESGLHGLTPYIM